MARSLEEQIVRFVERWEPECLLAVADVLDGNAGNAIAKAERYASTLSPAGLREDLGRLLSFWMAEFSNVNPRDFAIILRSCARTAILCADRIKAELTWTGPIPDGASVRRTEQALIEIVNSARVELWLASYSFFEFAELTSGLRRARQESVAINLLLEIASYADGPGVKDHQVDLLKREFDASIYTWSPDRRKNRFTDRPGVMHCKFVMADQKQLLVTSANLTDAAMVANMECGLILHETRTCRRLHDLLSSLIRSGDLIAVLP